jgi:YVTN family beta-propeller protein
MRHSIVARRAKAVRSPLRWLAAILLVVALSSGVAISLLAGGAAAVIAISPVGRNPSAIAADPRSGHVFVANSADNTVSMLDARTGRTLRLTAVGTYPDQVRVNPRTERVFVMNEGEGSVSVLDAVTGAVRRTLTPGPGGAQAGDHPTSDLFLFDSQDDGSPGTGGLLGGGEMRRLVAVLDGPHGTRLQPIAVPPHGWGLAIDGARGRLFVPIPAANSIGVFDVASGQRVRTIPVGAAPVAIAVDAQTGRAFVANTGGGGLSLGGTGSVSVLDSRSGRVLRTVAVGPNPALLAVDAPAGRVLVVHGWGGPGSADQEGTGSRGTDVLDARSGTVVARLAAGTGAPPSLWLAPHPQLVAVDERHGHAFVMDRAADARPGDYTAGRVSVLDDRVARVLRSLPVAPFPVAEAIDATAGRLFVVNQYADCHARSSVWDRLRASARRWLPFLPPPKPAQPAQFACASHGSVTVFDLALV